MSCVLIKSKFVSIDTVLISMFINVLVNDDCPYNRVCTNNRCVDPCVGLCGINANCVTRNHIGTCQCLPGHNGDPFSGCQVADPRMYKTLDLNNKNV